VVNISHKQEELELPKELATEVNDGWSVNGKIERKETGEDEQVDFPEIYATEWWGNDGFYAYAGPEEDAPVSFGVSNDQNQYINLRNQPYLRKGSKYELKLDFELLLTGEFTAEKMSSIVAEGRWIDPFEIFLTMDSEEIGDDFLGFKSLLYTNTVTGSKGFSIEFSEDKKASVVIQLTAPYNGIFNIEIRGVKQWDNTVYGRYIKKVFINECSLSELNKTEEILINRTLTEDYTTKKELELRFGDDARGLSSAFRLQKIKDPFEQNTIEVPILQQFPFQGIYYVEVDLAGANLIDENYKTTRALADIVEEVIYNYNQSDSHVIKLKQRFLGNSIKVILRNYNKVQEARNYWEHWTDSFYKVEQKRYPEIVANIHNRLFDKPAFRVLDYEVKNNIKFNDFIEWQFSNKKDWILTNCRWDIHNGL
jgi:hypothetical protein